MSNPKQPVVTLRKLNKENYREILKLKVGQDQTQFVASNAISLAQALFHEEAWFRGIYADDTAVGFVMIEMNYTKPEYFLWRFMIDENSQGKGYGYQAMELVIKHVKTLPNAKEFFLSYIPAEGSPQGFYSKLGFVNTGDIEEGEEIMRLQFD